MLMRLSILLMLISLAAPVSSRETSLYGYGVHSCNDLAIASRQWEDEEEAGALAHLQFREWLSGFISALSLALGSDVTGGAGVEGMMREVVKYCKEHRQGDVFSATMELIKERDGLQ